MNLTPLTGDDVDFVFDCLLTLRGQASYSADDLRGYCERWALRGPTSPILIARMEGVPVGMLTYNRFAVPRYLGFGIELEEVIIAPNFQGQGLAGQMIEHFLVWIAQFPEIRRVQVRTDDEVRAGKVYARLFTKTDSMIFTRSINSL
jgi:GNAT superfamily N-acetyltransferase